jgi:hypothetical protein
MNKWNKVGVIITIALMITWVVLFVMMMLFWR